MGEAGGVEESMNENANETEIVKGPYNDQIKIGDYAGTVWTGTSYLDPAGGHELFCLYVPVGSRGCRDGRMLVNRRPLRSKDRDAAIAEAIEAMKTEIAKDAEIRSREVSR